MDNSRSNNQAYVEAQVSKVTTMADHSMNVVLNVSEAFKAQSGAQLLMMDKKVVKVLLSMDPITTEQAKTVDAAPVIEKKGKRTNSQRVRDKIYHLHCAMDGDPDSFNKFYNDKIDYICNLLEMEIKQNERRD